ncbi:hypothetical protein MHBO_004599, partial [Bonamia ostreae]
NFHPICVLISYVHHANLATRWHQSRTRRIERRRGYLYEELFIKLDLNRLRNATSRYTFLADLTSHVGFLIVDGPRNANFLISFS